MVHEVHPAAQEVAGRPLFLRIDICHWKHFSTKKRGDLFAVDLVVLHLSAVDRFHVQRVAQHELDADLAAQVCDPVPAEHAFNGDRQILTILGDRVAECITAGGKVLVIQNGAVVVLDA